MRFHITRTIVKHFRSSAVVEGIPHFLQGEDHRAGRGASRLATLLHTTTNAHAKHQDRPCAPPGKGVPVVYHPAYSAPQLPASHRFPMGVFKRIYELLLQRGVIHSTQVHVPRAMPTLAMLESVHCPKYIANFLQGNMKEDAMRRIGLPWSEVLVERTLAEVAGTLLTAELALLHGIACNTAGGTHHAHRDLGSGFCIINDLAVTAATLLMRKEVSRVLIFDLDVHQGDGTAAIFESDPRVFTLSVHCGDNFPARKQRSDLDIALPRGVQDEEYLRVADNALRSVLDSFRPDLVLYDAGVDTHVSDALGFLEMTDGGIYKRERQVLATCAEKGVPVAGYVGGGYSRDIDELAWRHCLLHQAATSVYNDLQVGKSGAAL
mmetsp:Transcript_11276/g.19263  ORF Transcript_11276/g.19263 Transcript_11276/m.19263 type:complete len:378 (-) Transcript_11276:159-1292(-)